jgi:thymidylate synthase (FAD)
MKNSVIGTTVELLHGRITLIDVMGDDAAIDSAARTTRGGKEEKRTVELQTRLIRRLMRDSHVTPLEFVEFSFLLEKIPLWMAQQILRHRTASVNMKSLRYSEPDDFDVLFEYEWRKAVPTNRFETGDCFPEDFGLTFTEIQRQGYQDSLSAYRKLVEKGVALEQSRMNLPVATLTNFMWKMDLNNLFKFLELRLAADVQRETRELATAIYRHFVKPVVPIAAAAFESYRLNATTFSAEESQLLAVLLTQPEILQRDVPDADETQKSKIQNLRNSFKELALDYYRLSEGELKQFYGKLKLKMGIDVPDDLR